MKWKRSKKAQMDAKSTKDHELNKPLNNQKPSASISNSETSETPNVVRQRSETSSSMSAEDEHLYRPYVG